MAEDLTDDPEAAPPRPDDFYVALQPLTLDLIAEQLTRVDIRFDRQPAMLLAGWSDFVVQFRVVGTLMGARVTLRERYPADSITMLVGRCNWWNNSRFFLKASATLTRHEGEDGTQQSTAGVNLDFDAPFPAGIAPVQLQSLVRDMLSNIALFRSTAVTEDMVSRLEW